MGASSSSPLNDIEAFKAALPDARFVDGDEVIGGCRIKRPLPKEVELWL